MLFARVILQDAELILLDEPFSAIDAETSFRLVQIMKTLQQEKRTIICVSHDLEMIRQHFDECLLLARKCIAWGKAKDVLTQDNLFNAKLFHEAWQSEAEVCQVDFSALYSAVHRRKLSPRSCRLYRMSLGSAPLGVFMVLRRMSLAGDTLSHGIFSGVAIAFVVTGGVAFWPMTLGGIWRALP